MFDSNRNIRPEVPTRPLDMYRTDLNSHRRVAGFAKCMLDNWLTRIVQMPGCQFPTMFQCAPFLLFSSNGTNKCWDFVAFCIEQVSGFYDVQYVKSIGGNDVPVKTQSDLMAVPAGSILKVYNAHEDHVAHAAIAVGGGVFAGVNPCGYITAGKNFTAPGRGGIWTYNGAKRFLYENHSY